MTLPPREPGVVRIMLADDPTRGLEFKAPVPAIRAMAKVANHFHLGPVAAFELRENGAIIDEYATLWSGDYELSSLVAP